MMMNIWQLFLRTQTLGLKNINIWDEKTLDRIDTRFVQVEETISEFEGKLFM